ISSSIIDRFSSAPYGFIEDDIAWIVTKLFKDGDIAFYINNEAITLQNKSEDEIIRFITRREFYDKLLTERREKANANQKNSVKEIMKAVFGVSSVNDDDDALMVSFKKYAANMKTELEKLEIEYFNNPAYPGKQTIKDGIRLMAETVDLQFSIEFFRTVDSKRDTYLNFGDDYEPIKAFFSGEQRGIFDKSLKLIAIYEDSKTFIADKGIDNAYANVRAIVKQQAPYSEIYKLPELNKHFWDLYIQLLEDLTIPVDTAIDDARKRVFDELNGKKCSTSLSGSYVRHFDEIREKAHKCNNVASLQNIKIEVDALKVRLLQEIADNERVILEEEARKAAAANGTADNHQTLKPKVKKHKTVSIKSINTEASWQIESEEDIERYVSALKQRLKKQLEDDTIINVEF
ncbi:MAG TPA: BREX system P-loop protein BrxC, partial [Bacillota bacterium]|nr:BREX system P-loop protein BrxC [Bacillota bacterium]